MAPRCQVGPLRVPAVKTFSPLGDSGTLGPWETPSAPRELPPGVRRRTLARVNVRDAHTCALTKYKHNVRNVRLYVRANKVPGSSPTVRGHLHLRVTRGVLIFLST